MRAAPAVRSAGAKSVIGGSARGAMADIIWQQPPTDRDHTVRIAMTVPTFRELVTDFRDRFGIAVTSVFAMTENCSVTVLGPGDPVGKADSAGRWFHTGDRGRLTIDRPEARNALSPAVLDGLTAGLDEAETYDCRVLVLRGHGGTPGLGAFARRTSRHHPDPEELP